MLSKTTQEDKKRRQVLFWSELFSCDVEVLHQNVNFSLLDPVLNFRKKDINKFIKFKKLWAIAVAGKTVLSSQRKML